MAASFILSIDQGTTGTTVSLINTRGQIKVKVNQEFPQIFPKAGWVEHKPEDIWKSVVQSIGTVLQRGKIKGAQIATIGITNQRETLVAWDRKTGQAIGNAIVWQCRRTTDLCTGLKKRGLETKVRDTTGLVLDPYFSGTKMTWMLKNRPQVKKRAAQGLLCFGTIDSWLIWNLTGGREYSTDISNASRTLCMDLKSGNYSEDLLKIFQVPRSALPQIKNSAGDFGFTKNVKGLPDGIPISGVIGDQQSALFGQKCFLKGQAKITFGTGSFLLLNTGKKAVFSQKGLLTTVAWQLPNAKAPTYALEGGAFVCGAAVQWLRDNMGFFGDAQDIEKLAKKVTSSEGVHFVPTFAGLGAPRWDPNVRGAILGLTRGTGAPHIARAALEAMALQNVDIVTTMKSEARARLTKVRVDGGAVKNDLLMQMQSDFLGVEIERPKVTETTSLGAGLLAGLGVGIWSDLSAIEKLDGLGKVFRPKLPLSQRRKVLKHWGHALDTLQSFHGR